MDLNEYWQENKRFVMGAVGGAIVFLIAYLVVNSYFETDIGRKGAEIARYQRDLAEPMFTASDLENARDENVALAGAVGRLIEAADFKPRPEFALDPTKGAANTQYLRALSRVREELLTRANRANVAVEAGLGMPSLSPTREAEIVRYLETLDVIENVVSLALDARAQRIDRIQVRLDPGLSSRDGLGDVERTRVKFSFTGTSRAMTEVLARTQRPPSGGRVLHVDELELLPSRSKQDEVRLDLTLVVPRIGDAAMQAIQGEEE